LEPKKVPKGVVKEEKYRQEAIENLQNYLISINEKQKEGNYLYLLKSKQVIQSPIKGAKGNVEYLWWIGMELIE
jgi:predicted rRNA methylase YqxC with S4 and FtsJ domains